MGNFLNGIIIWLAKSDQATRQRWLASTSILLVIGVCLCSGSYTVGAAPLATSGFMTIAYLISLTQKQKPPE